MKNCSNCAWFCHADGRCYGFNLTQRIPSYSVSVMPDMSCSKWSFDGLGDDEREALMTMEQSHG